MAEHKKHLYYLTELSDYKVSDGYPDVRGWQVKDIDDRVIGEVDNLLVNKDAERVVYLDVEVDKSIIDAKHDPYGRPRNSEVREFVNKEGDNHIIIPIGLVDLNEDSNYIFTDIIDHKTFAETKRMRRGENIRRNYEVQVMDSYDRKISSGQNLKSDAERNEDFDNVLNETSIRRIVRDEIRKYHNANDRQYENRIEESSLKDEERQRKIRNDDVYNDDDDRFYDRKAFDDSRFKRRHL